MNKRSLLSIASSIIFVGAPLLVQAAQISPNPNTGTIIVDTSDVFNSLSSTRFVS
jgi:hypothetical protein